MQKVLKKPYQLFCIQIIMIEADGVFENEKELNNEFGYVFLTSYFQRRPFRVKIEASVQDGVDWWEALTASGGEGMVVKPYDFISKFKGEILQPAVKCRGREYLRIIYSPEYTMPDKLSRLKKRSLSKKRSLALREFSLGMESLNRFVKKDPLYKVHECVFGVLALESEPVDPRL